LTITHEFAHYLLHDEAIGLARVMEGEKLKPYHDPEWQAKAFAGEFLIPAHLISNLSIDEIVIKCGVSYEAARYQRSKQ
jgi:Zn-dependent peptidase ImmA (M78 family)